MALPISSWLRSSLPAAASASGLPASAATSYCRVQMTWSAHSRRTASLSDVVSSKTSPAVPMFLSPLSECGADPLQLRFELQALQRRHPGHVLALRDGLPDPVRQAGHVDVADPEVGDGVDDGVHEGGRATHGAALPDALAPDRVVGRRGDHLVEVEVRDLPCDRDHVVHVVAPDAVALGVEGEHLVV